MKKIKIDGHRELQVPLSHLHYNNLFKTDENGRMTEQHGMYSISNPDGTFYLVHNGALYPTTEKDFHKTYRELLGLSQKDYDGAQWSSDILEPQVDKDGKRLFHGLSNYFPDFKGSPGSVTKENAELFEREQGIYDALVNTDISTLPLKAVGCMSDMLSEMDLLSTDDRYKKGSRYLAKGAAEMQNLKESQTLVERFKGFFKGIADKVMGEVEK